MRTRRSFGRFLGTSSFPDISAYLTNSGIGRVRAPVPTLSATGGSGGSGTNPNTVPWTQYYKATDTGLLDGAPVLTWVEHSATDTFTPTGDPATYEAATSSLLCAGVNMVSTVVDLTGNFLILAALKFQGGLIANYDGPGGFAIDFFGGTPQIEAAETSTFDGYSYTAGSVDSDNFHVYGLWMDGSQGNAIIDSIVDSGLGGGSGICTPSSMPIRIGDGTFTGKIRALAWQANPNPANVNNIILGFKNAYT